MRKAAVEVHDLDLTRGLSLLATYADANDRAAFKADLPDLLEQPTLADYARRLAHEIGGAGHPPDATAERITGLIERIVDGGALYGPLDGEALGATCGGELAARRTTVLRGMQEALAQHGRYQAAIERYRSFLENQSHHLDGIVATARRDQLAERLLGTLRALCRGASRIDADGLRRLCRRLRQEQT